MSEAARRAQILDRGLEAYRIGDPEGRHAIMNAEGARIYPGRWNTADTPFIYASAHYSTAMLEKLAHGGGRIPPNQHFVTINIEAGASYEVFPREAHPDWASANMAAARAYGAEWARTRRSLVLLVPSVVARMERNVLLNPAHAEFAAKVRWSLHEPVWWDARLWG